MRLIGLFLICSGIVSRIYASNGSKRGRSEQEIKATKHNKRTTQQEDFAFAERLARMNLSSGSSHSDAEDLARHFGSVIPRMTDYEIRGMIDEAIDNSSSALIEMLQNHDCLAPFIDFDHIDALIRSKDPESTVIFRFILANVPEIYETMDHVLVQNLCYAARHENLEKFEIMWDAFHAETSMDEASLAGVLSKVSCDKYEDFYRFIMGKFIHNEEQVAKSISIRRMVIANAVTFRNLDTIMFILTRGGDAVLEFLDLDQKIKSLKYAVTSNRADLVRELLKFPDVLVRSKTMPRSPILEAVVRDFPEVLAAFVEAHSEINLKGMAMYAFNLRSIKVLEYLRTIPHVIDESMLFSMASAAISGRRKDSFEIAIRLGLNLASINDSGDNLLTMAVEADDLEIAEYLLTSCSFDPNATNINHGSFIIRTTSTAIHSAKSAEMIKLLAENGADVNARFIKETRFGAITKNPTALHNAASMDKIKLFDALIKAGADITIPDTLGASNEAFYHREYLGYSGN